MEFTGERMIPESNAGSKIYLEHINRYNFANQFVKDKDVLDIACGSGYGTNILHEAGAKSILGVDISEEAVTYCKGKYPLINFSVGSVEKIPAQDDSIDVLVSFETIEHVDENTQEKFMQEINRVLRKDGIFVLSTPNALVYEKGNEFHIKELNPEELDALLKKYGFEYEIFFQESIDANYILSSSEIENGKIGNNKVIFENEEKRQAWDTRYLIVVCSKNRKISEILSSTYISNIKSVRHQVDHIALEQTIVEKTRELEMMKSSKFWKLREKYIRFKNLLKRHEN